jgi:hypothetical protein
VRARHDARQSTVFRRDAGALVALLPRRLEGGVEAREGGLHLRFGQRLVSELLDQRIERT